MSSLLPPVLVYLWQSWLYLSNVFSFLSMLLKNFLNFYWEKVRYWQCAILRYCYQLGSLFKMLPLLVCWILTPKHFESLIVISEIQFLHSKPMMTVKCQNRCNCPLLLQILKHRNDKNPAITRAYNQRRRILAQIGHFTRYYFVFEEKIVGIFFF